MDPRKQRHLVKNFFDFFIFLTIFLSNIKARILGLEFKNEIFSILTLRGYFIYLFRFPVVCTEPFRQLAQLATHLEKLKPIIKPTLATFIKENTLMSSPDRRDYEMVKLEEDSLLCGFNPWFRGLDWALYRRYAPRSIPSTLVQVK